MKYVNQLSHEEITALVPFLSGRNFEECESKDPETRTFKVWRRKNGKPHKVIIGDTYDQGNVQMYLRSEDHFIRVMSKKFGEKYIEWYINHCEGEKNRMRFLNRLTHEEIMELIPFYQIYDFEELKPLQENTRRFEIQPTYGGPRVEVIMGDAYDTGTAHLYGVKEKDFLTFMLKKFGKEYFEWYSEYIKNKALDDCREYMEKMQDKVSKRINFCKSILSE